MIRNGKSMRYEIINPYKKRSAACAAAPHQKPKL
jgi:hypothetical protein